MVYFQHKQSSIEHPHGIGEKETGRLAGDPFVVSR